MPGATGNSEWGVQGPHHLTSNSEKGEQVWGGEQYPVKFKMTVSYSDGKAK